MHSLVELQEGARSQRMRRAGTLNASDCVDRVELVFDDNRYNVDLASSRCVKVVLRVGRLKQCVLFNRCTVSQQGIYLPVRMTKQHDGSEINLGFLGYGGREAH